jgi:hypothetical protein
MRIVLGFDGSYNNDSTALIGCTVDGQKPYLWVGGAWEKPSTRMAWLVPREEVKARFAEAFDRWEIVELACDPPGWHTEIDEWEETYGSPPVLLFETNKRRQLSDACSRFYTAVVNGELEHAGNPRLAQHLAQLSCEGDARRGLHQEGRSQRSEEDRLSRSHSGGAGKSGGEQGT